MATLFVIKMILLTYNAFILKYMHLSHVVVSTCRSCEGDRGQRAWCFTESSTDEGQASAGCLTFRAPYPSLEFTPGLRLTHVQTLLFLMKLAAAL